MALGTTFSKFRRSLGQYEATTGRKIQPGILSEMFRAEADAERQAQARSRAISLREKVAESDIQYRKKASEEAASAARTSGMVQTGVLANLATEGVTGKSLLQHGKEGILAGAESLGLGGAGAAATTGVTAAAEAGLGTAAIATEVGAETLSAGALSSVATGLAEGAALDAGAVAASTAIAPASTGVMGALGAAASVALPAVLIGGAIAALFGGFDDLF